MTPTWNGGEDRPPPRPGLLGWALVGLRGSLLVFCLLIGTAILVPVRLAERLTGTAGVWPRVPQLTFRVLLVVFGLRLERRGSRQRAPGIVVANHSSWLDIIALNAAMPVRFVAKSDVAGWPVVGTLARLAGTLFISRRREAAAAQRLQLADALRDRPPLLFFPEGTSSDGLRVLPFKPTLFAALYDGPDAGLQVQPVSVSYAPPRGEPQDLYSWWGGMSLGPHLTAVLSRRRFGSVRLVFHPPLAIAAYPSRKALSAAAEAAVRQGFTPPSPPPAP